MGVWKTFSALNKMRAICLSIIKYLISLHNIIIPKTFLLETPFKNVQRLKGIPKLGSLLLTQTKTFELCFEYKKRIKGLFRPLSCFYQDRWINRES